MPIELTASIPGGVNDPDHTYTHVKITQQRMLQSGVEAENTLMLDVNYGWTVDIGEGVLEFRRAKAIRGHQYAINGSTLQTLIDNSVALVTDGGGYNIYAAAKRTLCQYLIDEGHYAGTVVDLNP